MVDTVAETGIGLTTTSWSQKTYQVVATSLMTDLDFLGGGSSPPGGNGFGGLIDLVSLLEIDSSNDSIPEPGTLALFGIGLAGLGFLRRRRRT